MVARYPSVSSLLINESPLIVLPSLAVIVGLHEAIFLQQVHYWLQGKGGKVLDGRRWVYNTRKEWQEQFPFWSVDTIKRAVESLKKQGVLVTSAELNKSKMDRTLWYTIDYDALNLLANAPDDEAKTPNGKAGAPNDEAQPPIESSAAAHSNQETSHEITSEITQERVAPLSQSRHSPTGERAPSPKISYHEPKMTDGYARHRDEMMRKVGR